MLDDLAEIIESAATDDAIGALVLTGAGDAFCAGVDLSAFADIIPRADTFRDVIVGPIERIAVAIERCPKPVIGAIPGVAVGAGADFALMCDIRFASDRSRMAWNYVKHGLVPGEGGCFYLPRLVGPARALEILLTGDFVDALELERLGLVNHVVPHEALMAETQAFAERLASAAPVSVGLIKRSLYESMNMDLRASLDLIASHQVIAYLARGEAPSMAGRPNSAADRPAVHTAQ